MVSGKETTTWKCLKQIGTGFLHIEPHTETCGTDLCSTMSSKTQALCSLYDTVLGIWVIAMAVRWWLQLQTLVSTFKSFKSERSGERGARRIHLFFFFNIKQAKVFEALIRDLHLFSLTRAVSHCNP